MKRITFTLALVAMLLATAVTARAAQSIVKEDYGLFQTIIKEWGFMCATCDGGDYLGDFATGKRFRVYCNDNSIVYIVTVSYDRKAAHVRPEE